MYNPTAYALGSNRSVIRELFEYGNRRAAIVGRENVYDYSLGNPSIPAPPEVNQAIRDILSEMDSLAVHGYTSAGGDLATRQAIADDLNARYDAGVGADDLFIGCGAAPELVAAFTALAAPGGEVLAIAPYFPEYGPFVRQAGMELKVVPPDVPNFQIKLDAVEAMLNEHTQAIIINSPNNPAGTVYTEQTLRELGALLERKSEEFGHPIYIISDEPYRELVYGGVTVPFIPKLYRNTLVCYSYSKSLSLPGERIGYVYVPKTAADSREILADVAGASRGLGLVCAPSLMQKVIARCATVRPDLEAYDRNRKLLLNGLRSAGYTVAEPDGAFYLFVQAPGGDAMAFSEKAKAKDLLVVPGDGFGCPGYFRICYCVSEDLIRRSIPVFASLI